LYWSFHFFVCLLVFLCYRFVHEITCRFFLLQKVILKSRRVQNRFCYSLWNDFLYFGGSLSLFWIGANSFFGFPAFLSGFSNIFSTTFFTFVFGFSFKGGSFLTLFLSCSSIQLFLCPLWPTLNVSVQLRLRIEMIHCLVCYFYDDGLM